MSENLWFTDVSRGYNNSTTNNLFLYEMFLYETQHWVDNEFKVENKVHGDLSQNPETSQLPQLLTTLEHLSR